MLYSQRYVVLGVSSVMVILTVAVRVSMVSVMVSVRDSVK